MTLSSSWDVDAFLERLRPWMPLQNPLPFFVHNNVLMSFEERGFHEGLYKAARLYRARPYCEESFYREEYRRGRIDERALRRALADYASGRSRWAATSGDNLSTEFLERVLKENIRVTSASGRTFPSLELESLARALAQEWAADIDVEASPPLRLASLWERVYGEPFTPRMHEFLIPLLSSYLDQGLSLWRNPYAQEGLLAFFKRYLAETAFFQWPWLETLRDQAAQMGSSVEEALVRELRDSGVEAVQWEFYALELLFDLKGWAGIINKLETEPEQATVLAPACSLRDYLLVRLVAERSMNEFLARKHSLDLSLLRRRASSGCDSMAVAEALCALIENGLLTEASLRRGEGLELLRAVAAFTEFDRLRVWHEAYENAYYTATLNKLAPRFRALKSVPRSTPRFQVLFCIDDREGSLRRHLEEVEPETQTFGVPGFFSVDMKFVSLHHDRPAAQCPPVMPASRRVFEVPMESEEKAHERFRRIHHRWARAALRSYDQSRSLVRGFAASLFLGLYGFGALALRVWAPSLSERLSHALGQRWARRPRTRLALERREGTDEGYSKQEMAGIVTDLLRMGGLTRDFAPLVLVLGHGASSSNNPFKQAYGCGACGGNPGAPNARAFALMANDPEVRRLLKDRGLDIPEDTLFVGAYHDTTIDEITYFEAEAPRTSPQLDPLRLALTEAARRNALERCRYFKSFRGESPDQALHHVRERARDLGQPRPEYGHAGVSLAIVGRRDLTRNLFLGRRAFLISYDPELDPDGSILRDVCVSSVPVCANINLDYYFSRVDNENFGCGSKLPLNVTALLGVMTGASSDLRIGLAKQMVEIHEPMRLLLLVEATREKLEAALTHHARLRALSENSWMRVGRIDPETRATELLTSEGWEPFTAETVSGTGAIATFPSSLACAKNGRDIAEVAARGGA